MEDAMTKQTPTSQTASEDAIDNPGGRFAGERRRPERQEPRGHEGRGRAPDPRRFGQGGRPMSRVDTSSGKGGGQLTKDPKPKGGKGSALRLGQGSGGKDGPKSGKG
jgi:hypothetical protein